MTRTRPPRRTPRTLPSGIASISPCTQAPSRYQPFPLRVVSIPRNSLPMPLPKAPRPYGPAPSRGADVEQGRAEVLLPFAKMVRAEPPPSEWALPRAAVADEVLRRVGITWRRQRDQRGLVAGRRRRGPGARSPARRRIPPRGARRAAAHGRATEAFAW